MSPILKEVRKTIREIKKINKGVFPIPIKGGIYAKPISNLFKRSTMWNFISAGDYGYLSSHAEIPKDIIGYCGCPLSGFNDDVKLEVLNILKEKLEQLRKERYNG